MLEVLHVYDEGEIHAVLAKVSDLFGIEGGRLLDRLLDRTSAQALPAPYAARVGSLRRIMDQLDFEIDTFARLARGRLAGDEAFVAVQAIPGIGPTFGALFVAEIGEVSRFASADKLTCWAGMTPRHHESDTHVHRGRITKQGNALVRWAAVESVQRLPATSLVGAFRERVAARRGRNIAVVAAARRQLELVYYALRDGHVRALQPRPGARGGQRTAVA